MTSDWPCAGTPETPAGEVTVLKGPLWRSAGRGARKHQFTLPLSAAEAVHRRRRHRVERRKSPKPWQLWSGKWTGQGPHEWKSELQVQFSVTSLSHSWCWVQLIGVLYNLLYISRSSWNETPGWCGLLSRLIMKVSWKLFCLFFAMSWNSCHEIDKVKLFELTIRMCGRCHHFISSYSKLVSLVALTLVNLLAATDICYN